jgi:hypothetical protein
MEKLKGSFRVRLLETNIGEIFGTPEKGRRISLLKFCRECLTFGDCLMPHQEIITEMALKHRQLGKGFRWQNVDVTVPDFANAVLREDLWNNEALSSDQREHLDETAKKFLSDCPLFHAVTMVSVMGHFQYGLPKDHTPSKYKTHFYDLLMGCQLPYCDVFVTHEKQQQNRVASNRERNWRFCKVS